MQFGFGYGIRIAFLMLYLHILWIPHAMIFLFISESEEAFFNKTTENVRLVSARFYVWTCFQQQQVGFGLLLELK